MNELVDDDITTTDIEKSALKVGCLFACLLQKKNLVRRNKIIYLLNT